MDGGMYEWATDYFKGRENNKVNEKCPYDLFNFFVINILFGGLCYSDYFA